MNFHTIPITKVLTGEGAIALFEAVFGAEILSLDETSAFDAFMAYYNDEILQLDFGPHNKRQSATLALNTHGNFIEVVQILGQNRQSMRPKLRNVLRNSIFPNADDLHLNRSIDVALRLWLMVNVRERRLRSSSRLRRPCLEWNDDSTLIAFVSGLFPKPRWELTPREGRYDPDFTAAFMTRICGLNIAWTTSLEDHLRLDRKTKTLWVFPHKSLLQMLLHPNKSLGPERLLEDQIIIPRGILLETIQSLLLLFPEPDKETQMLLKAHKQNFHEHEPFEPLRPLGILDFDHWRDRLLELYQEVYQVQSPSWRQLLRDQRNPQQWLAFWLGLFIAVLTLVSTLADIISMSASIDQAVETGSGQTCMCNTSTDTV